MKTNFIYLALILIVLVSSCSLEKRLHRPGFYVDARENNISKHQTKSYTTDKAISTVNSLNEKKEITNKPSNIFKENVINEIEKNENKIVQVYNENKDLSSKDIVAYSLQKNIPKKEMLNIINKYPKNLPLLKAQPAASSGKNQIVALLLCFFLGMLGVHSFYLGNKTKGLIQLGMFLVGWLTLFMGIGVFILSALGIWVFIDFIRLIIGDLGPGW